MYRIKSFRAIYDIILEIAVINVGNRAGKSSPPRAATKYKRVIANLHGCDCCRKPVCYNVTPSSLTMDILYSAAAKSNCI